jgi:hypothetical protein
MRRKDGGMDMADRRLPPQALEMSRYSVDQEITSIGADFLVELRGIEPLTSAVRTKGLYGIARAPWRFNYVAGMRCICEYPPCLHLGLGGAAIDVGTDIERGPLVDKPGKAALTCWL